MSAKRTSGAVMTSLIVHGVVFVIAGIYLVTQTQQFRDRFGAEVLQAKEPPNLKFENRLSHRSSQQFQLQIQWLLSKFQWNVE